jgi:hypothetical protein
MPSYRIDRHSGRARRAAAALLAICWCSPGLVYGNACVVLKFAGPLSWESVLVGAGLRYLGPRSVLPKMGLLLKPVRRTVQRIWRRSAGLVFRGIHLWLGDRSPIEEAFTALSIFRSGRLYVSSQPQTLLSPSLLGCVRAVHFNGWRDPLRLPINWSFARIARDAMTAHAITTSLGIWVV